METDIRRLFTIGYATVTQEDFIHSLKRNNVTAVSDVRSSPFSSYKPEFNRQDLEAALKNEGIKYVFLGDQCGARIEAPHCYVDGLADYHKIAQHPQFLDGLKRIRKGLSKYSIALMCAEKDPITCHRMILVCRNLKAPNVQIAHIRPDGSPESNDAAEKRLLALFKLDGDDMFQSKQQQLDRAYDKQGKKIAYKSDQDQTVSDEPPQEGSPRTPVDLFTIGFTKSSAEHFFARLQKAGVHRLVDIRLNNVSQLAGFAKRDDLAYFLKTICQIEYEHLPSLAPTKEILDAYKKKEISWAEYERRYLPLLESRQVEARLNRERLHNACFLCSEPTAGKCHRRLAAEYLKRNLGDINITHL